MADKSDWFPRTPLALRDGLGERANVRLGMMTFRDGGSAEAGPDVWVEWPMSLTILREADKADPLNQLRTYTLMVGDTAFRLAFSDLCEAQGNHGDLDRLAMMAFVMLGIERGDEIKAAIARARGAAKEAAD